MTDELGREELLEWLVEAHSSESCLDAIDKEHSTTYQTPEYWGEKARIREQAYQQIKALIQKPEVTEEWINNFIEEKAIELNNEILLESWRKDYYIMCKDFIRSLYEEIK